MIHITSNASESQPFLLTFKLVLFLTHFSTYAYTYDKAYSKNSTTQLHKFFLHFFTQNKTLFTISMLAVLLFLNQSLHILLQLKTLKMILGNFLPPNFPQTKRSVSTYTSFHLTVTLAFSHQTSYIKPIKIFPKLVFSIFLCSSLFPVYHLMNRPIQHRVCKRGQQVQQHIFCTSVYRLQRIINPRHKHCCHKTDHQPTA